MGRANTQGRSSTRRRLQPEGRRRELLDAGLSVIRAKGAQARIADVIREAGAARGTFYVYFNDWNEYVAEVRDHLGRGIAKRFAELSAGYDDWQSFWRALPGHFIELTLDLGGLEVLYHGPLAAAAGEDEFTRSAIRQLVEQTASADAMRECDVTLVSALAYAAVHEGIEQVLSGADSLPVGSECGEFLVGAMAIKPTKRS